ncbi:unnamed protein product [Cladocopium goreaui]|uniref:Uncharacterized protein n=1 Tax=Cladocopium goreaui TaxID=2562237 RepID=A0A9P1CSS0_9DINO|nr:unnamed protein product [Cladocopium goreaui]
MSMTFLQALALLLSMPGMVHSARSEVAEDEAADVADVVKEAKDAKDAKEGCWLWGKCCTPRCNGLHQDVGSILQFLKMHSCIVEEHEYYEMKHVTGQRGYQKVLMKPPDISKKLKAGDYVCKETCRVTYKDGLGLERNMLKQK